MLELLVYEYEVSVRLNEWDEIIDNLGACQVLGDFCGSDSGFKYHGMNKSVPVPVICFQIFKKGRK
jgi:hypothetical protein